ncbi:conjugal transfer protein TraF [Helicobacter sp. 11S03491-1]|uniref:conjugal transfer protein TraF n=1 Tax=Helicobacter sp. 11S03491-1 TaxID=1476196 RepID=UPI000BA5309D|nr:conjugal transfer protein TraF [Helicobacter sp. 11S03491-1]PAF42576.1 hypothetical protein BKH45_03420 [Helicobacter sp. 11S03491-1]
MNKIFKIIFAGTLLGGGVDALEFGSMGNISASMGGAGVALRNSQWALYYNPALLGMDKKSRIAYSFGISVKEKNLLSLAGIDYNELKNIPNKVQGIAKGSVPVGGIVSGAVSSSTVQLGGSFGDILKNISFGGVSGLNNTTDVQNFMVKILESTSADKTNVESATTLTQAASAFKTALTDSNGKLNSDGFKAFGEVKNSLLSAVDKTGGNAGGLLKNVIENIQPEQLGGIADLLAKTDSSASSIGLDDLLKTLGGVSISKGNDAQINTFIQDIFLIQKTLRKNNFNVNSQNGLVFQVGGNGADGVGAVAFGLFANVFASGSATFDSNHNQIIIDAGSNQYTKVDVGDNSISLNASDKASFEAHSLFSPDANHQVHGNAVFLSEIPIGYGQAFSTLIGNFSVGFTAKYIFAMGYEINKSGSFKSIGNSFNTMDFKNAPKEQTFGIDFGLLYNYKGFNLGVVGKNLNSPTIEMNNDQKLVLNSQYRAGISYEWKIISLALDADLKPNHTLSYLSPLNQMVGGGVMIDLKYVDFRLGSMYDLRSAEGEGIILTGGINILGFLDLAIQSSTKLSQVNNVKMPGYLSIKLGGGFSW